jgi:hypothetical protein
MSLADYRDLSIVVLTGLLIVNSLLFLVFALIAFWKLRSVYLEVSEFVNKLKTVSNYAITQVIEPIVKIAVLLAGVREGLGKLMKIFSNKGE